MMPSLEDDLPAAGPVSPRRPGHPPAAQKMKVEMGNILARIPAGVEHDPVARLFQVFQTGDVLGLKQEASQQGGFLLRSFGQGGKMVLGDNQDVDGGLGLDVLEGQEDIVLIDHPGRYFPADDLAENAIAHRKPQPLMRSMPAPRRRSFSSMFS
jgi:hypothetical protein